MMREKQSEGTEGVSPVIGVILMVAITVILAALVGTFVLGVGDDLEERPRGGLEVVQDSNSVRITVIDGGNLDDAQIVGPQGGKSMRFEESLGVGTRVIIDKRGFNNTDVNFTKPPSPVQSAISGTDNLVDGEECLIRHSADVVYGVQINGSDIGCSGKLLEEAAGSLGGETDFAGSEIDWRADSDYNFIGIRGSKSTVIRRIRSGDF